MYIDSCIEQGVELDGLVGPFQLSYDSMKMSTQCVAAVKKANSMLGIIRKGIENKTASIILPLYKSMVQPHFGHV